MTVTQQQMMLNARLSSVQTRYLLQLYSEAISDQISGAPRSGFPPELVIQCPHFQPHKDQSPSPRAHLIVHQPYLWITQRKGDEICKYIVVIVCKLCNLKEARASKQSCNRNHMTAIPLGTNFSEWLNIQKRDCPLLGPSFTNSWPRPFPHFPQRTWR